MNDPTVSPPLSPSTAFARTAEHVKAAESAYRKSAAAEIARHEAARVTAFRRVRLLRLLEQAAATSDDPAEAIAAQKRRLCQELGWSGDLPAETAVLDRLQPVCHAVSDYRASDGDQRLKQSLTDFETWFETERRAPFYALFDQYVQETPVVDF